MKKSVITVRFIRDNTLTPQFSEKEYAYYTDIEDIQVGDWVIVVVQGTPKAVKVEQVSGLSVANRDRANKWIVSRIDLTNWEKRMAELQMVMEIENQLDEEFQQAQRMTTFVMLADSNPRIAALLDKLREINPELVPKLTSPAQEPIIQNLAAFNPTPIETTAPRQEARDKSLFEVLPRGICDILWTDRKIATVGELIALGHDKVWTTKGIGNDRMNQIERMLNKLKLSW